MENTNKSISTRIIEAYVSNPLHFDNMRTKYVWDSVGRNPENPSLRMQGYNLKNEVIFLDGYPYQVSTNNKREVIFLAGLTESKELTLEQIVALVIKWGFNPEDIDALEVPKLLNTNDVKGCNFLELLMCNKGEF